MRKRSQVTRSFPPFRHATPQADEDRPFLRWTILLQRDGTDAAAAAAAAAAAIVTRWGLTNPRIVCNERDQDEDSYKFDTD